MSRFMIVLTALVLIGGSFFSARAALSCYTATSVPCGSTVNGTTIGGTTDVDTYNCSTWDESGPEVVYRVNVGGDGDLTATISGMSVDLDVFLLGSCDENDCLASGNSTLTYAVSAGTYYIVVDGYNGVEGSFSLVVNCPSSAGGLDCTGATALTCGVAYNGNTTSGVTNVETYSCTGWVESGPERVHVVTTTAAGNLTATLTNLSVDLDVFILASCDANDCRAYGDNAATYSAAPIGTYYIVVDGYSAASGSYTLTMTCPTPTVDSYEPDNDCSNANYVTIGATQDHSILPVADYDWYTFTLSTATTCTVRTAGTSGDTEMWLYQGTCPSGLTQIGYNDDFDGVWAAISESCLAAGTYFVKVGEYGNDATIPAYTFTFRGGTSNCAQPCVNDTYEPNNTRTAATTLTPGTYSNLKICSGDEDWYGIGLQPGDTVDITISFANSAGNLDLDWQSSSGSLLHFSHTNNDVENILDTISTSSTYYLRVFPTGAGVENTYQLSIVVRTPLPCIDDSREPNDFFLEAPIISAGTISNLKICAGNEDWFGFNVAAGNYLAVTMRYQYSHGDLDLGLYGPTGSPLTVSATTSDTEFVTVNSTGGGRVYIRAYGYTQSDSGTYSLTVVTAAIPPCQNDVYEPNNSAGAARILTQGTYSAKFCPGDEDWYKVNMVTRDQIMADLRFTGANGNIDFELRAPDGVTILSGSYSSGDQEHVQAQVFMPGYYYLRVFPMGSFESTYSLSFTVAPGPPCSDDHFENNDNWVNASAVAAGTYTGLQICSADTDWYSVNLRTDAQLVARINFLNAQGNIDMQLIAADGHSLLRDSRTTNDFEQVSYTAGADGFVYMKVWGNNYAENTYELVVGIIAGTTCPGEIYEPNDTYNRAAPIAMGSYTNLRLCPEDVDWYALTIAGNQDLLANISFDNSLGNLDLYLYASNGSTRLAQSITSGNGERITYHTTSAGTYLLEVIGASPADSNHYNMFLSLNCVGNQSPVINSVNNDAVEVRDTFTWVVNWTDPNVDDTTVTAVFYRDGRIIATGSPVTMHFDTIGSYTITLVITDDCGAADTLIFWQQIIPLPDVSFIQIGDTGRTWSPVSDTARSPRCKMTQGDSVLFVFENNGGQPIDFGLRITSSPQWVPNDSLQNPWANTYRLYARFNDGAVSPPAGDFRYADIVSTAVRWATVNTFGGGGVNVLPYDPATPVNDYRATLWLMFEAPDYFSPANANVTLRVSGRVHVP